MVLSPILILHLFSEILRQTWDISPRRCYFEWLSGSFGYFVFLCGSILGGEQTPVPEGSAAGCRRVGSSFSRHFQGVAAGEGWGFAQETRSGSGGHADAPGMSCIGMAINRTNKQTNKQVALATIGTR